MARPKKENADYHTHDKEMRNDPKIRALRRKFKHDGYSVYNMMLEVLTGSDNWEYPWNDHKIELIKGDFDAENLEEIINYCVSPLGLFTIDKGYIFSLQHQKRFLPLLSKRKRDTKTVSDTENPYSIVKYSKEEESKVGDTGALSNNFLKKNRKTEESGKGMPSGNFEPPEFDDVNDFFYNALKNYWDASKCNLVAQRFFNHYKSLEWKTAAGAKVYDWKALANKWILDDLTEARRIKSNVPRHTHTAQPSVSVGGKDTGLFIQAIYEEFKAGIVKENGLPADIYGYLIDREKILISADQKRNILSQCNGDEVLAKKRIIAQYFKGLIDSGVDMV